MLSDLRAVCINVLAFILLGPGALATAVATEPPPLLDEVEVRGPAPALEALRQALDRLEDRFYDRYNELNTNDLFDVHCADAVRTGTRLARRYCRAVFEEHAFETEGRGHLWALQFQAQDPPKEWIPPTPPIVAIERRRQDFRRAMIEVTSRHPELLEILKERAELAERYEQTRRDRFGIDPEKTER